MDPLSRCMCNSNSSGGGDGNSGSDTMVEADRLWRNGVARNGAARRCGSDEGSAASAVASSSVSSDGASSSRSDTSRYYSCDDDEDHLLAQCAFECDDDDEFEELTSAVLDVDALMERRAAGRRHSDPGNNRSSSSSSSPGSPGRLPPSSFTIEELPWHQPMPPRLPLRTYGGALTSIDEVPHLEDGATFTPTHRFSNMLALPSTMCGNDEEVAALNMDGDLIVDFPHNLPHKDTDDNQSNSTKEEEGSTHIDPKGCCVHHPHVQLVQHHPFGAVSTVLLRACPDCCMEELHRLHSSINSVEMDELRRLHLSSISEESSDSEEDENYEDEEESVDTRTTLASSRSTIHEPEEQSQGNSDGGKPKDRSRRRRPTEETMRSESDSSLPKATPRQSSRRRQFKSETKPKTLAAGAARLLRRCGRRGDA